MTVNWPTPTTAEEMFRQNNRQIDRLSRAAFPTSAATLMGPGMSAQAIRLVDWNDEIATFNGFFWTKAGALNAPEIEVFEIDPDTGMPTGDSEILPPMDWSGMVVARDDGTGSQHLWNTDEPEMMYSRVRNYWPNPTDPTAPPVFGEWMRWATSTGFIEGEDLAPEVQEGIQSAYEDAQEALLAADEAFDFAEASNAVFRQSTAPTNPTVDGVALRTNDTWFDTDDSNRPYTWNGSMWVDATQSWLISNPSASFPNVVMSPAGLAAYNGAGVAVTTISSTDGRITTTGSVWVAGDISGATVTGGTVQTDASVGASKTGIKMNSAGMIGYHPTTHTPTFAFDTSTGQLTLIGGLLSGGTVTGATVQTATSGYRAVMETISSSGQFNVYNSSTLVGTLRAGPFLSADAVVLGNILNGGSIFLTNNIVSLFGSSGIQLNGPVSGMSTITFPSSSGTVVNLNGGDLGGANVVGALSLVALGGVSAGTTVTASGRITGDSFKMSASQTGGSTANTFTDSAGVIFRITSTLRDKNPLGPVDMAPYVEALKDLPVERYTRKTGPMRGQEEVGLYAEHLDRRGLKPWVLYDDRGRPDGIAYDRLVLPLLAWCQQLERRLALAGL